jgi:hypothetical protein
MAPRLEVKKRALLILGVVNLYEKAFFNINQDSDNFYLSRKIGFHKSAIFAYSMSVAAAPPTDRMAPIPIGHAEAPIALARPVGKPR